MDVTYIPSVQRWNCKEKHPRKQFSVKVGSIMEDSPIALDKWLATIWLIANSKNGVSSYEVSRSIGVTQKSAWFMLHRIRLAMEDGTFNRASGIVEADETYIGTKKDAHKKLGRKPKAGWGHKHGVFTLVERGGKVRSLHVEGKMFDGVKKALAEVSKDATLMTDEASMYRNVGKEFAGHETVNHSIKEYVRGAAHVNTAENFFSIFKRGMKGVYQHCSGDHLHRYLVEFDFRYNHRAALEITDRERACIALQGIEGKRLIYKRPAEAHPAT